MSAQRLADIRYGVARKLFTPESLLRAQVAAQTCACGETAVGFDIHNQPLCPACYRRLTPAERRRRLGRND